MLDESYCLKKEMVMNHRPDHERIVITGVGLAAPNASNLTEFREKLLAGKSEITTIDLRYMEKSPAGICTFAETKYRKKKKISVGPEQAASVFTVPTKRWLMPELIFQSMKKIQPGSISA